MRKKKKKHLIFKSERLVMNPGQAPHLKCAPGHKSKDNGLAIDMWRPHWRGTDCVVLVFQMCDWICQRRLEPQEDA